MLLIIGTFQSAVSGIFSVYTSGFNQTYLYPGGMKTNI